MSNFQQLITTFNNFMRDNFLKDNLFHLHATNGLTTYDNFSSVQLSTTNRNFWQIFAFQFKATCQQTTYYNLLQLSTTFRESAGFMPTQMPVIGGCLGDWVRIDWHLTVLPLCYLSLAGRQCWDRYEANYLSKLNPLNVLMPLAREEGVKSCKKLSYQEVVHLKSWK